MTALVSRPDLSKRTILSKSAISEAEWCQTSAWFSLHERRPMIETDSLVFGSCLDAAVEQLMIAARAGIPMSEARPLLAAEEVLARSNPDVAAQIDLGEIARACEAFIRDVIPHFDWELAVFQMTLHEDLEGIGEAEGHPDIAFHNGDIFDIKSSSKRKGDTDAATSIELGFYGLLREADRGGLVTKRVGYMTWVRSSKPHWQILEAPFTDEMRRRTRAVASAYVRAKAADALLNKGAAKPINFTLTGGPKFAGKCGTCQYNPAFGGSCQLAVQGEISDVA